MVRTRGRSTFGPHAAEASQPRSGSVLLFNKPYGVLCQFTDPDGRPTLSDFIERPGFYAAGRLDRDSEGLLVLTSDGAMQHRLSSPRYKLPKRYLVQVEGKASATAIAQLRLGVLLKDGLTAPAHCQEVEPPLWLWPRIPPIRERARIPTSWLVVELTEGRNRQLRRMTAAVNLPTLRLVRTAVAGYRLGHLAPGESLLL